MKFKDYIGEVNEKNAQGNTETSNLISLASIPLTTKMMDRLGYSYEDEAYHVTSEQYLESLIKLQGKKKQISAFTKGGNELMKLPSNPTILVKLEGNIVIDSESDMWTHIDNQGRRWISLQQDSENNGTKHSEQLKFFIYGIINKIRKDLGYEPLRDGMDYKKIVDINRMTKSDRGLLYKRYFDEIEKYLDKGGYKLLNAHLKENITYSYNEVILNNFKIQGAYSLDNNSKEDVIKSHKIKYLGIKSMNDLANIGK
jgi:hypothetical protein